MNPKNLDGISSIRKRTANGSGSVGQGQPASNGAGSHAANNRRSQVFYERPAGLDGLGPRLRRQPRPNQQASNQQAHDQQAHDQQAANQQPTPPPKTKKPKKGRTLWVTIIGTLVALVLLVGGGFLLRSVYSAALTPVNESATESKLIHIEEGMSSSAAANLLAEQDLIRSALALRWHLRLNSISGDIQAGVYQLAPSLSTPEIADTITNGETVSHTITITGGTRLQDVVDKMVELGFSEAEIRRALNANYDYSILAGKPLAASLEGYLFPDTYHIGIDNEASELVDIILANMESKTPDNLRKAWAKQGLDLHEAITLASIVQKEVSNPSDQKRVAQVFLKRLKIGMKLEADPTFEYGAFLRGVTATPETDSPYNTYQHAGLPPGPISNVGESAMRAVADPADTDYLYFVSAPDGTTYFSQTKDQHEANIERYLR